jgi:hypothetical protein
VFDPMQLTLPTTVGNVTFDIRNAGLELISRAPSVIGGTLDIDVFGDLTQQGALIVVGTTDVTATGDIDLTDPNNDFQAKVTASGVDVSLTDVNALVADVTATGDATLKAGGDLDASLHVIGDSELTTTNGGNVTVDGTSGTLKIVSGGTTTFGDGPTSVTGTLDVTGAGDIDQTGTLTVGGPAKLTSTTGDIVLTESSNEFGGPMTVAANNINIAVTGDLNYDSANAKGNFITTASNNLIFNNVAVGGNLVATSLNGNINRTGTIMVVGSVSLLAPNSSIDGFVTQQILDASRTSFVPEPSLPTNINPALIIISDPANAVGTLYALDGSAQSSSDGQQITVRFADAGIEPSENLGDAISAAISVVILKAGSPPDSSGSFTLTEVDGTYIMSTIDRPAANEISFPGKPLLNQIEMKLVDARSSNAVFRLELVDNGLVIKPVGIQAKEMIENKRNQVIGMALAELRKQTNISINAIQTVFIIL